MRASHLLDTCALLDLISGRWNHPEALQELQKAKAPVVLSLSAWEIARKIRLGKLTLPCGQEDLLQFLQQVLDHFQLSWLPVNEEIALRAESFPMHHKDPVDRMILAGAASFQIPVFTSDRQFGDYEVAVIQHRI